MKFTKFGFVVIFDFINCVKIEEFIFIWDELFNIEIIKERVWKSFKLNKILLLLLL
jgi:hypothetical protein